MAVENGQREGSHCEGHGSFACVPAVLRARRQWVCWRRSLRRGKETKVPYNARTHRKADTTDPSTWSTFDEAAAAWQANRKYSGVGFVVSNDDQFVGIDLDDCIDERGRLSAAAQEIISSIDSYSEISPSGVGVRIFAFGTKPLGSACQTTSIAGIKKVEVYAHSRYFTVTGAHVAGTPLTVEVRQAALDALYTRLGPSRVDPAPSPGDQGTSLADDDVIRRATEARNGDKFETLWKGDTSRHADDDSAADLALCAILAFWTRKDPTQIDRLFRQSRLMRPKWNERHSSDGRTYGQMTGLAPCQPESGCEHQERLPRARVQTCPGERRLREYL